MSVDRSIECDHVDEKKYIRGGFQQRACFQHLSEHHKIEIEPHIDILFDYANQIVHDSRNNVY
jgi:hypothetical protein